MAGWFEAFAAAMRGAEPALDRYQQLRQLDDDNKWKRKLQQVELDRAGQQQQMNDRQLQLLDNTILGNKRVQYEKYHMPGQEISDEGLNQANALGLQDIVSKGGKVQPLEFNGAAHITNQGMSAGPQQGLGGFGMNFADGPGAEPGQMTATDPMAVQGYQLPEEPVSKSRYLGTPEQIMDQYTAMKPDRDMALKMAILQGIDPKDPSSLLRAQGMGMPVNINNAIPRMPANQNELQTFLSGTPDQKAAMLKAMGQIAGAKHIDSGGGDSNSPTAVPMTPENLQLAANNVVSGRMAPSQAAQYYGGFGKEAATWKREIIMKVSQLDPTFNFAEADSNYAYGRSPGVQTTVRFLDNIQNTIPKMKEVIGKLGLVDVRPVNWLMLKGKNIIGDADVAKFNLVQLTLADEIAKILQGGGTGNVTSDAKLKQAQEMLGSDMAPAQWAGVLDLASEVLKIRRNSLTSGTYMANNMFGGQDPNNPAPGGDMVKMQFPGEATPRLVPRDQVTTMSQWGKVVK